MPFLEHGGGAPAVRTGPAVAARGLEEQLQRLPVGFVAEWPFGPLNPFEPGGELGGPRGAETVVRIEIEPRQVDELQEASGHWARKCVPAKVQAFEVRQVSHCAWDRACEFIPSERQGAQGGQAAQFGRNGSGQGVVADVQAFEVGEAPEFGRDRAGEFIPSERQVAQGGQAGEFGRDRACKSVIVELKDLQAGQAAQFGRNRARKGVAAELQTPEVDQIPEFGWDASSQGVVVEPQVPEAGQAREFGRDGAL